MRREKKQQNKTKLISNVYSFIAEGHTMKETEERANKLCKFYFPNADEIFLDTFRILVVCMQNKYWTEQDFDFVLRHYN